MEFSASKSYAITGESGSGKTTIINLTLGLLEPTKGSIVIRKNSSKIVGKIYNNLNIGYITQDPILLDGSIRENVELFNTKRNLKNMDKEILLILNNVDCQNF